MLLHWWKSWREKTNRRLAHLYFIMFTRQGCHLCEDAWKLLQDQQRRWGFHLEAVDVDQDDQLREMYGQRVPVITVDGKVRFWGRINPVLLERLLTGEANKARKETAE